jgi:26S proteasome regulatory subunit N10
LKKNNVAVDVISFGQEDENQSKLNAFVEAVNNSDNRSVI